MKKFVFILLGLCLIGWWSDRPKDMPSAQLASYKNARPSGESASVGGECDSDKCLVVYVAPWCSSCKRLTPTINDLVEELESEGISAKIVVGKDSMNEVLDYSKRFNSTILEDSSGRFFSALPARGVPYFAVANQNGKIISELSGGYKAVSDMRAMLDI